MDRLPTVHAQIIPHTWQMVLWLDLHFDVAPENLLGCIVIPRGLEPRTM
jgi:hypothetical protein